MSTRETMIQERFNGDVEAYKQYMRSIGSKGGKISKPPADHPGMFSNNIELARRAGRSKKKPLIPTNVKRIVGNDEEA